MNVKSDKDQNNITEDNVKTNTDNQQTKNNKSTNTREKQNSNLIPINKLPENIQRQYREKAAETRRENNRKRKEAKEIMQQILETKLTEEATEEILGDAKQLIGEDRTAYAVLLAKLYSVAASGNTTAIQMIKDTVGDVVVNKQQIEAQVLTEADKELINNVKKRLLG